MQSVIMLFTCLMQEFDVRTFSRFLIMQKNFAGQPRRHLLTTGWSVFVSSKKLVAGDAFIFLR